MADENRDEALELRPLTEDEADECSFYVDPLPDGLSLTQHKYYRWGDTAIIAVGELNYPNHWDDEDFEHTCNEVEAALAATRPAPKADSALVGELQHMLDRDRYIVAIALGTIRKALDGHRWLLEGRGPYEWDDDRYRDEFAAWVRGIEASTGLLAKLARDHGDCTTDTAKVQAAREAAREYAVDAPVGHRTMLPSDLGLPCPSCAALSDRDVVLEDAAKEFAYPVGAQVLKPKGYPFPGTVVAAFENLSGDPRYVVESEVAPGMLHIFSGAQLAIRALKGGVDE